MPGALGSLAAEASATNKPIVSGITRNVGITQGSVQYSAQVGGTWPNLLFHLGVNQPGSLLRLEKVREVGSVRDDLSLCMDLELWLRLALAHGPDPVAQVAFPVAAYRYHSESKTCSGDDVFSLEEFRVLTGLAIDLDKAPAAFPWQVERLLPPKRETPYATAIPFDGKEIERAYFDRMLVSDSLLFRALLRGCKQADSPQSRFLGALEELRPTLGRLYSPRGAARVESRALVHALQNLGRIDIRMVLRTLRLDQSPRTMLDLARLATRSISRP